MRPQSLVLLCTAWGFAGAAVMAALMQNTGAWLIMLIAVAICTGLYMISEHADE